MYDLKKIQTISQASASVITRPIARPVARPRRRAEPAINVRSPRLMMGLIFLFLLLAYLIAYAQEAISSPRPYLVVDPPAFQSIDSAGPGASYAVQPEQPMPKPLPDR